MDKTKRVRSGNRSFVTKIIKNAHDTINKFGGTQPERNQLEGYNITLEDKKRILETLDQTILESVDDEGKIDKEVLNTSKFGQTVNRVQEIGKLAAQEYWNHSRHSRMRGHSIARNNGHTNDGSTLFRLLLPSVG